MSRRDDDGFTVVEVVLAMAVLAVAFGVFATALRIMTTATSRVSSVGTSATAARQAGDLLGRQASVASAANIPGLGQTGTTWYVEFTTDAVRAGDDPQCTQWRYLPPAAGRTGTLDYRTSSTVTRVVGTWQTVASSLVNDPLTQPPFTLYPPDAGFKVMRLSTDLRVQVPGGPVLQSQGQYTLRNSLDAPVPTTNGVCTWMDRQ